MEGVQDETMCVGEGVPRGENVWRGHDAVRRRFNMESVEGAHHAVMEHVEGRWSEE